MPKSVRPASQWADSPGRAGGRLNRTDFNVIINILRISNLEQETGRPQTNRQNFIITGSAEIDQVVLVAQRSKAGDWGRHGN